MNSECLMPLSNFLEMISFWIASSGMGKLSHYNLETPEFTSQLLQASVFSLRWCLMDKVQSDNFCKSQKICDVYTFS